MTERASRPVDGASLAAFRVLFGGVMFVGLLRYALSDWPREHLLRPRFFFKYEGFEWVQAPSEAWLYALLIGLAALALMVALGLLYRVAIVLFALGFAYVQLIDATNYLNHYYLVVVLAAVMVFLPLNAMGSLDARLRPQIRRVAFPAWMLWLVRFQVGVVYVHAGLAKLGSDWLLHAQPMRIWLASRTEMPVVGPWLDEVWLAYAVSWAGFLYDATIVGFLLWRRTRVAAYVAVLAFHAATSALFEIGMFPLIMIAVTPIFFAHDWPRRWLRARPATLEAPARAPRAALAVVIAWCAFQALFPLRHFVYPGDVLWNEAGMRFAWKVMVREKAGSVTLHVRRPATGRAWQVNPRDYLEWRQLSEMSAQPALIAQMARHVAADFRARGLGEVEVRAEAWVSLNGRPPALLIDPAVDLAGREPDWTVACLPAAEGPPLAVARR